MADRLVEVASGFLERRTDRRGFLIRAVVVGSAVAVAPLRYLMRPESAWGAITCANCSSSSLCCRAGYTEMCCSVYKAANSCPPYSFYGGWWKCENYQGSHACAPYDVRYYLDCNRHPAHSCDAVGGYHTCGGTTSDCGCRPACHFVFNYGNCNTNFPDNTHVVCRVIKCQNPGTLTNECSITNGHIDNDTCDHEACCHCGNCW